MSEEEECEPCKLSAGVQISLQICKKKEDGTEYCDILLNQVLNNQIGVFEMVDKLIERYQDDKDTINQLNEIKKLMSKKGD